MLVGMVGRFVIGVPPRGSPVGSLPSDEAANCVGHTNLDPDDMWLAR